jgi:ribosomal protein S18 acetylase RimI-like enzyme
VDARARIAHHLLAMRKTTSDLTLRPKRPADDAFLFRISDRLFAPYSVHPTSAMSAMLGERGACVRVAEIRRAPVGFFVVGIERFPRPFGPWKRPALARLNAIGVAPEAQGRGVGRFLLGHAEEVARDDGAVSMTLMTADTNDRARRLFRSAGYQELYALDGAYAKGQRGIVMTKAL